MRSWRFQGSDLKFEENCFNSQMVCRVCRTNGLGVARSRKQGEQNRTHGHNAWHHSVCSIADDDYGIVLSKASHYAVLTCTHFPSVAQYLSRIGPYSFFMPFGFSSMNSPPPQTHCQVSAHQPRLNASILRQKSDALALPLGQQFGLRTKVGLMICSCVEGVCMGMRIAAFTISTYISI